MDPFTGEPRSGADPDGPTDARNLPVPKGPPVTGIPGPLVPARVGGNLPAVRPPRPQRGADGPEGSRAAERAVEITAGDFLLTVGPADGSRVVPVPPGARPAPRRADAGERRRADAAVQPAPFAKQHGPDLPLLERHGERERLVKLLARGSCVRLTGPSGAGRSSLLRAVADRCGRLAPDGVVRLSGYRRTPADLLYALFGAVYHAPAHRPSRARLLDLLRGIGAVVVVDDVEFGGAALEELAASAPECAFLVAATPDVPALAADSVFEEVLLPGLSRVACLELLEHAVQRPLEDEEAAWAADLWFESEGLPLRFVQAGALLRQRDARRVELAAQVAAADRDPFGSDDEPDLDPVAGVPVRAPAAEVPLPTLAESAAPVARLAAEVGEAGREALRFAAALDGECPNAAHLPALVGDTHGDAALGELAARGLVVPVAAHYRLAAGVAAQVDRSDNHAGHVRTATLHFAWWAGHPSVGAERVAAEAEAVLAALAASRDVGDHETAVLLARAAAPAFAAALHWSAWERALRTGQECARQAGDVGQEAYFHHELGVLALCSGNEDRARAELEASVAMRAALADRDGTAAGRAILALLPEPVAPAAAVPTVGAGGAAETTARLPRTAGGLRPMPLPFARRAAASGVTAALSRGLASFGPRRLGFLVSRRNLATAGAGVLLAAALGTAVTLGASDETPTTPMNVAPADTGGGGEVPGEATAADPSSPEAPDTGAGPAVLPAPAPSSPDAGTPSATQRPDASSSAPEDDEDEQAGTGGQSEEEEEPSRPGKPSGGHSSPPSSPSPSPSGSGSGSPSTSPSTTPDPSDSASEPPPPASSNSASVPAGGSDSPPAPGGSAGTGDAAGTGTETGANGGPGAGS